MIAVGLVCVRVTQEIPVVPGIYRGPLKKGGEEGEKGHDLLMPFSSFLFAFNVYSLFIRIANTEVGTGS